MAGYSKDEIAKVQVNLATRALSADTAKSADTATTANTAKSATTAKSADTATTATTATKATNADHATTADTATNANHAITADSANTANTANYATTAGNSNTADYINGNVLNIYNPALYAITASYALNGSGGGAGSGSFPYTGSAIISGSLIITGSTISTLGFTGSLFGTSSWAQNYTETDPIFVSRSASLATTGSNTFNGNQIITGSLFIVQGTITLDNNQFLQSYLYDGTPNIPLIGINTSDQVEIAKSNVTTITKDNLIVSGTVELKELTSTPTPFVGGIMYSSSDFYLGL